MSVIETCYITSAMRTLEQYPSGGVGDDGYTTEELEEFEEKGQVAEGDAGYHTVQKAWRELQSFMTNGGFTK